MATRVTSTRLVGRTGELAELEAALQEAADGRPSLAFLAGESGVGKSRLLAELERRAREEGATVLGGDAVELGEGELPYAPLVGALRPLARSDDAVLGELTPANRAELATLLPELARRDDTPAVSGADDERGSAQRRLFEALLSLLERLGQQGPVVLALEDVHWADRSTRAFLAFLARSLCDEPVLVILTYRSDELHRRHPLRPLLAELERAPRARRIELARFDRDELAEQLEDILGAPPAPDLVDRLLERSEGNPLFAEELLASGLDGRGGLPPTLRDALMVRVERLPDTAQEVLRLLAAGRRLDHQLLEDASGLEPRELREALRVAVESHIAVGRRRGLADVPPRAAARGHRRRPAPRRALRAAPRARARLRAPLRRGAARRVGRGAHRRALPRGGRPARRARGRRAGCRAGRRRARARRGGRAARARPGAVGPRARRRGARRRLARRPPAGRRARPLPGERRRARSDAHGAGAGGDRRGRPSRGAPRRSSATSRRCAGPSAAARRPATRSRTRSSCSPRTSRAGSGRSCSSTRSASRCSRAATARRGRRPRRRSPRSTPPAPTTSTPRSSTASASRSCATASPSSGPRRCATRSTSRGRRGCRRRWPSRTRTSPTGCTSSAAAGEALEVTPRGARRAADSVGPDGDLAAGAGGHDRLRPRRLGGVAAPHPAPRARRRHPPRQRAHARGGARARPRRRHGARPDAAGRDR